MDKIDRLKNKMKEVIENIPIDELTSKIEEDEEGVCLLQNDMEKYNELVELVKPLYRWFDIDKVKFYSVLVWGKLNKDENEWHIFDIEKDGIIFCEEESFNECDIPTGAFPIIRAVQNKLREMETQTDGN